MDFPSLAGSTNDHLDIFVHLCFFAMMRDKAGTHVPAWLGRKIVALNFKGRVAETRSIAHVLDHVHFDVWPTCPRVCATVSACTRLPQFSWYFSFLSVFFASFAFMQALNEKIDRIAALSEVTLSSVFNMVTRGSKGHIQDWFGRGHQYVRLQANYYAKFGKKQARTLLLQHLQRVEALELHKLPWKSDYQWRMKEDIMKDLRRCPGIGLYQGCQLWLFLAFAHDTYPKQLDQQWAACGPGTRRGLLWLNGFPAHFCNTNEAKCSNQFFYFLMRGVQHKLLSHSSLRSTPGDSQHIRACKEELKKLLQRVDGVTYMMCELQRVIGWLEAHPAA